MKTAEVELYIDRDGGDWARVMVNGDTVQVKVFEGHVDEAREYVCELFCVENHDTSITGTWRDRESKDVAEVRRAAGL